MSLVETPSAMRNVRGRDAGNGTAYAPDSAIARKQIGDGVSRTVTGSAANTSAAPAGASAARIDVSVDTWIRVNGTAAATTGMLLRVENRPEHVMVDPGQTISMLRAGGVDGVAYVTWLE